MVTGAAGFIGGHVARRLAGSGRQVLATDLPDHRADHLRGSGIERRDADITDAGGLLRALSGVGRPDAVIHCAAVMGAGDPDDIRRVNVEGTRNVAAWAAAAGAGRFVYLSSVTVYGLPHHATVDEGFPFRRAGLAYADSKMEAETLVRTFHEAGLPSTILRPADVYGPRAGEWVVKLVDAMRSRRMILIAGGRGIINLTHVDNLTDAIEAALAAPRSAGRDYIITDGDPVTWRTYLRELARAAGCPPPRLSVPGPLAWPAVRVMEAAAAVLRRRPPLSRMGLRLLTASCTYNIDRARAELSWAPRVDRDTAMREIAGWLRSTGSA